eukprot:TRINITY_DN6293_c0_g1_i1.p1 TRINITY_DN6293_c0_g1~~TRINITY_DN6293_c0_g1_i1.p1  ORF type:complete len:117 (+),score=8.21 TRINITY_DN6293_c0_g1_i1:90-440(+)
MIVLDLQITQHPWSLTCSSPVFTHLIQSQTSSMPSDALPLPLWLTANAHLPPGLIVATERFRAGNLFKFRSRSTDPSANHRRNPTAFAMSDRGSSSVISDYSSFIADPIPNTKTLD